MPHKLARKFRAMVCVIGTLCILSLAFLKGSMWIARLHIHNLITDVQSIRPMQSDWSDAQSLMHRWGRWGSYRGTCTSTDCTYTIAVEDLGARQFQKLSDNARSFLFDSHVISSLEHLGWREVRFIVIFTVQDGIIVRLRTDLSLQVPPHVWTADEEYGYTLILRSQVRTRLTERPGIPHQYWILGPRETPSDHPDYKMGRPSGCEGCLSGEFTYTPTLSHNTVVNFTSYNLSCLTRWRPCRTLADLLPSVRGTRFDDDFIAANHESAPSAQVVCLASPRALARDANIALQADVISVSNAAESPFGGDTPLIVETARLRVRKILKGNPAFAPGEDILVLPHLHTDPWDSYASEHFTPGKGSILFLSSAEPNESQRFATDACGIVPDTPEILNQVKLGISQDVPARHGDTWEE